MKKQGRRKAIRIRRSRRSRRSRGKQIEEEVTWYSMLTGRSSRGRKIPKIAAFTKKHF